MNTVNQTLREVGMQTTMWAEQETHIEHLKVNIIILESRVCEDKELIAALKAANKAKDALVAALTDDLVTEKKQVLRWEEFAHGALRQQENLLAELEAAGIGPGKES